MKSLHKKIGVVALSSALVMGGAVAGASHMRDLQSKGLVAEAAASSIKVPFLLKSQLDKASKQQIAENDARMIYGLKDVYNYYVREINEVGLKPELVFKDGNEFLNYLSNNDIKEGVRVFKVGRQNVSIQFNENISKGKYWWLYLDKWLYLDSRFIKDLKLIWGQDN